MSGQGDGVLLVLFLVILSTRQSYLFPYQAPYPAMNNISSCAVRMRRNMANG